MLPRPRCRRHRAYRPRKRAPGSAAPQSCARRRDMSSARASGIRAAARSNRARSQFYGSSIFEFAYYVGLDGEKVVFLFHDPATEGHTLAIVEQLKRAGITLVASLPDQWLGSVIRQCED